MLRLFFAVVLGAWFSTANALPPFVINSEVIEPFSSPDFQGFDDRIAREMYRRAGYDLQIKRLPAERGLIMADQGVHDGILSRVSGVLQARYPNLLELDEATFQRDFVAFSKNPNLPIKHWDDLKHYHVGLITGWKILENNITQSQSLTKVKGVPQLFRLVMEDRVDVIIFARYSGLQKIKDFGYQGLAITGEPLASKNMAYYVHRNHQALLPRLNAALREIKADGTWQTVYDETIGRLE